MLDLRVMATAMLACIGIVITGFHFLGFSEPNIAMLGPSPRPERAIAGPPLSLPSASLRADSKSVHPTRPAPVDTAAQGGEPAGVTGSIDGSATPDSAPLPASIKILRVLPVALEKPSAESTRPNESPALLHELKSLPETPNDWPESFTQSDERDQRPESEAAPMRPDAEIAIAKPVSESINSDQAAATPDSPPPESKSSPVPASAETAGSTDGPAGSVNAAGSGAQEPSAAPEVPRTVRSTPKPKDPDDDGPNKVLLFFSKYGDPARNKLPAE